MRLNEIYNYKERFVPASMLRFGVDVFGTQLLTPHEEMSNCIRLFETEPLVNTGVTQMKQFIMGNNLSVDSKDTKTKTYFDKWIDQRTDWLDNEIGNFITSGLVTGNMAFDVERDEKNCVTSFRNINDTSRLFKNIDDFGRMYDSKKYCFYEVTPSSGVPNAEWFQYSYLGYRNIGIKRIYGVPIPKKNIILGQIGWSRMPCYGRSFLCSALEDGQVLRQIKQAFAVIAKYKAVPRKIVQIGDANDNVTPEELEEYKSQIEDTEKGENLVVNKAIKIDDLSYAGEEANLDPALQHVWKAVISGLAPAYLVGFATDTNKATSSEIKVPFWIRIQEFKKTFINVLNKNILQDYFKAYPWMSRDATFKFGDSTIDSTELIIAQHNEAFLGGTITFNECRKAMGKPTVDGGDMYKWQIDSALQGKTLEPGSMPLVPANKKPQVPILIDSGMKK